MMRVNLTFQLRIFLLTMSTFLLLSCGQVKPPDFKGIENLQLEKLSLNEPIFNLDLHYFNPNKGRLQIKFAEGDAWMDNKYLGHFKMDTLVRIAGKSDFRLPVTFKAELGNLFRNSLAAMLGQQSLLRIEGKARVGKSGLFINYPIRYEGKHNLGELLK
jgi:hypothetical protein